MEPTTPTSPSPAINLPVDAHHPHGKEFIVALAGNPNVGKTTLFNALTGLRQKVANYPGVTVEKKTGRCRSGLTANPNARSSISPAPIPWPRAAPMSTSPARWCWARSKARRARTIIVSPMPSNLNAISISSRRCLNWAGRRSWPFDGGRRAAAGQEIDFDKLSRHLRVPVVPVCPPRPKGQRRRRTQGRVAKLAASCASRRQGDHPMPMP